MHTKNINKTFLITFQGNSLQLLAKKESMN